MNEIGEQPPLSGLPQLAVPGPPRPPPPGHRPPARRGCPAARRPSSSLVPWVWNSPAWGRFRKSDGTPVGPAALHRVRNPEFRPAAAPGGDAESAVSARAAVRPPSRSFREAPPQAPAGVPRHPAGGGVLAMKTLEQAGHGDAGAVFQRASRRVPRPHGHVADDVRHEGRGRPEPDAPDRRRPLALAADGGPGPGVHRPPGGGSGRRARSAAPEAGSSGETNEKERGNDR